MLEPPDFSLASILATLQNRYGIVSQQIEFLPLGADLDTAVYRAAASPNDYFVKLRRGYFNKASVDVPHFLHGQGLQAVIPPLPTLTGDLTAILPPFNLIVYPFVAGLNGFDRKLTDRHRIEFGRALKFFHSCRVPNSLVDQLPRERFSSRWRAKVKMFLHAFDPDELPDTAAEELLDFLTSKRIEIDALINRADQLAGTLPNQLLDFIVCHGDIHGWNLLIDPEENLFIVDWDTLIMAPKERDLMFVGCGLGGRGHTLNEEKGLFYKGYGQTKINQAAIAYYRYERIIEDIAVYCEQLLLSGEGGADRPVALQMVRSNFGPGKTIDIAYSLDKW